MTQGLIRFDSITGPSGIPSNALILNATLNTVTTAFTDSQSGGAYNVYGLTVPFDSSSTYAGTFGSDGIAGEVGPLAGSFNKPEVAARTAAHVDPIVQRWANGGPNHGFGIRSDNGRDGWSVHTTGSTTVASRPQLSVTFTTDPNARLVSYRQGVNGYTGTVDSFPNGTGGSNVGTAVPGSSVSQAFLDGSNGTDSFDQPYLVKFNDIQSNFDSITKAELVVTSGFSSAFADTNGPFTVHRVLRAWDPSTTYASLDSDGNSSLNDAAELEANGFVGPGVATVGAVGDGGVVHLDITSIVEAWRAGNPNHGIYIGAGTANGWQIFASGADDPTLAPELRVIGVSPIPEPAGVGLLGLTAAAALARRRRQQLA